MLLAKDGIFPITKDSEGKPTDRLPASGFDFPGTIQGEGKLCGIPSLFIRLAGCNLRCCWTMADGRISLCDTSYAAYELQETQQMEVDKIYDLVVRNTSMLRHIVITGGEPFLQAKELNMLCAKLKENNFHITVETNATIFDEEVARHMDLFSLSPKLSSSQREHTQPPYRIDRIQSFINYARQNKKDFQMKFVYSGEQDIPEIHHLLAQVQGWQNEDILLMPLGGKPDMIQINIQKTLENCIRNGWRYCDRLHITLFGDKPGT